MRQTVSKITKARENDIAQDKSGFPDTVVRKNSNSRHGTEGHQQGYRFTAANFAKFSGAICEILQNSVALLCKYPTFHGQ